MNLPDELYYYDGTYDDGPHYEPLPDDVLRSYIEGIIRATMSHCWNNWYDPTFPAFDAIIAAAEVTP